MTIPSSQSARPPTLWPPPRIAVSRSFARPRLTAANDVSDARAAGSKPLVTFVPRARLGLRENGSSGGGHYEKGCAGPGR